MRMSLALAALTLVAPAGLVHADEVDHPAYLSWAKQPAGTRITLRSLTDSNGHVLTTTTTTTLKQYKPDRAVFEVQRVSDATGKEVVSNPEPYQLVRRFPLFPGVQRADIGKPTGAIAQGEEDLQLAGHDFHAVWFDTQTKGDGGLDVFTRTWMSDDAPGRLVKSVTRIPQARTVVTVELVDWTQPAAPAGQ